MPASLKVSANSSGVNGGGGMAARSRGSSGGDRPTVAVVLSGAVARGAFQAGALAELVPALERDGLTPTVWLGTSAGSINAVLWGSAAHRDAATVAEEVLGVWRRMSDDDVVRPLLPFSLPRVGLQFATGAVFGVGPGTTSLLDTGPLRETAEEVLETGQLAANIADGVLDAVGAVATRMPRDSDYVVTGAASGRSVLFLDEHSPGEYAGDPDRALDVVRSPVTVEHVLASSAFPVAFPPVQVTEPDEAAGWYLDGGVRLNAPLRPASDLGATRIVLVSANATRHGPPPPPDPASPTPDLADAAAQVLRAMLADRMIEDLLTLRRTNRLVAQAAGAGWHDLLLDGTGRPYREIDVIDVSPPPGEMGRIAVEIFDRKTAGFGRFTEMDNWLIGQLIRGAGDAVGRRELLSYLFFDEEYFAAGIELGRRTAAAALSRGWQR
ncbi:MAG: patatin-like phospholipase family protein [Mycobacterium leprae]